jgi:hypothetical protein
VARRVLICGIVSFVALGVVVLLVAANWGGIRLKLWPTTDDASIHGLIQAGYTELQTAIVPATPICPGPIPAAVQEQMLADLQTKLPRYFTGPALTRYRAALRQSFSGGGPACVFGGGVSAVELSSVQITGSSAEAQAGITTWARSGQYQGSGRIVYAQPSGPEDCTIELQKVDGRWLISDDRCTFPPGSGP